VDASTAPAHVVIEERIQSGCRFIALSVIFGGHGVWSLVAYRTGDRRAWTDRAIQGGIGVVASGIFVLEAMRFLALDARFYDAASIA